MFNLTPTALKDLFERAIRTFVGVFFLQLFASGVSPDDLAGITDWSIVTKAALAGAGAVLAILIGFVLSVFGPKNGTTSLVPDVVDAEVVRALNPHIPEP
jgi:hypothetical protein